MAALIWTEELRLNQPQMDRTHQEFVELLAGVRDALDEGAQPRALARFDELLEHTVAHFAQEDRWMQATGFAPENCHTRQHAMVLQVMRDALRMVREDARWDALAVLSDELAQWFPMHAQMMDAALAMHMAELGYDPATGDLRGELPATALTHCGGSCG